MSYVDPDGTVTTDEEEAKIDAYLEGLQWELAGGSGGGCSMEGVGIGCGLANEELSSGAAQECPNDNCGIGTSTPYTCIDSVCGYMPIQYATSHENEWNGVLYTDAEFAKLEANAVEAQQEALADAIAAATGQSWDVVYGALGYQHTKGGNANFTYTGTGLSDLFPQCPHGGEGAACRSPGSGPSIHRVADDTVHRDMGNPFWDVFGLFRHVGDLFGMINSSVPFGTGATLWY